MIDLKENNAKMQQELSEMNKKVEESYREVAEA